MDPDNLALGPAPENIIDNTLPGIDINDITIGIELEMAIYGLPEDLSSNAHHSTGKNKQMLKDLLKDIEGKLPTPHNSFAVKDDLSIDAEPQEGGDGKSGIRAEVITPILSNGDWMWVIPEMCTAITKAVTGLNGYFDFAPERSTSVHVHIGVKGRHYTLGELKRIAKAVVVFESAMDYHHLEHRRRELKPGMLFYIESCRLSPHLSGLSTVQAVDRITGITGSHELLCNINGVIGLPTVSDRFYRYNFCATTKFGTIEFRQADGSLDGKRITAWVLNVITFLTCAVIVDDENFRNLAIMADEGFAWDEVICGFFGLPPPEMQGLPIRPGPPTPGTTAIERFPAPVLGTVVVQPPAIASTVDPGGLNLGGAGEIVPEVHENDEEYGDEDDLTPAEGTLPRRRKRDAFKRINARINARIQRVVRRTKSILKKG